MRRPHPICRILIIEDDTRRSEQLKAWLPEDMRAVVARSAGAAIGILNKDRGHNVYAGILLDHDLERRVATEADQYLCGADVAEAIKRNVSNGVPVLVHSMNVSQAPLLVSRLEGAGFTVERIPMANLTQRTFTEWVHEARLLWQDLHEE